MSDAKPYTDEEIGRVRDALGRGVDFAYVRPNPLGSTIADDMPVGYQSRWLATLDAERAAREESARHSTALHRALGEAEAENERLIALLREAREHFGPGHLVSLHIDAALAETDTEGADCEPTESKALNADSDPVRPTAPSPTMPSLHELQRFIAEKEEPTPAACRAEREQRSCPTCGSADPRIPRAVEKDGLNVTWCFDPFHTPPAEADGGADIEPFIRGEVKRRRLMDTVSAIHPDGIPEPAEAAPRQEAAQEGGVTHTLKTWPRFYAAVAAGDKPFEIRRDDRGFAVGDLLRLREYDPDEEAYAGREITREVSCVVDWEQKPGFVVMGFMARAGQGRKIPSVEEVAEALSRLWNKGNQTGLVDGGEENPAIRVHDANEAAHEVLRLFGEE